MENEEKRDPEPSMIVFLGSRATLLWNDVRFQPRYSVECEIARSEICGTNPAAARGKTKANSRECS